MKMHKIILTTEACGPVLFLGRSESEAIATTVAYIANATWEGAYGTGWYSSLESNPTPKHLNLSETNRWIRQLHEDGELAILEANPEQTQDRHTREHYEQYLADRSVPFEVYSQEDWEQDEKRTTISDEWIADESKQLVPLLRAEYIVHKLKPILRLTEKEVGAAICTLMRSEVCRSRPGVLAGAAIRLATRFSAIEIHIVDIERALERLWRETGDADCRAAYQTIRERILLFTE